MLLNCLWLVGYPSDYVPAEDRYILLCSTIQCLAYLNNIVPLPYNPSVAL